MRSLRSTAKRAALTAGVLLLAGLWLGPLPELAGHAFFAHMIMHMGVVAVSAPLIAIGLSGGGYDPVRRLARSERSRLVGLGSRLFQPIPASILELVVVWGWHAPALHHFARGGGIGLAAEQGMFLAAGLLVWLSAFGGDRSRRAGGVAGLLLTAMHMTLLGALLALASRPLYHLEGAFGLTALEDQHLGGAIMLLVGGVTYLAGGLYLTAGLLRKKDPPRAVLKAARKTAAEGATPDVQEGS